MIRLFVNQLARLSGEILSQRPLWKNNYQAQQSKSKAFN